MTDNNHPITPPPELVEQWRTAPEYASALEKLTMVTMTDRRLQEIASQAARWGADQELEACRLWVSEVHSIYDAAELLNQRRPKPPSLKQQALGLVSDYGARFYRYSAEQTEIIRRALEQLDE